MADRAAYWREYKRAHPQPPRDRVSYYAKRHERRKAEINAARRAKYAATRSKRAVSEWRRRRTAEVAAVAVIDRTEQLATVAAVSELRDLAAAQARDDRTYRLRTGWRYLNVSGDVSDWRRGRETAA